MLIHTGRWARRAIEGEWDIMKNSAGLHASCLPWLKKRDVSVIGSDLEFRSSIAAPTLRIDGMTVAGE